MNRAAAPLLLALVTCLVPSSLSAASQRADVEERQREFLEAVSTRDADGTAAMFAEDAVLHVAGMPPVEGRTAIRQFYGNMFGFLSASSAVPEATHVSSAGDLAYSIGRTSNTFSGPRGTAEYTGKYLLVWKQNGGDWRIAVYSISSNQQDAAR